MDYYTYSTHVKLCMRNAPHEKYSNEMNPSYFWWRALNETHDFSAGAGVTAAMKKWQ